ncbi:hypothetical protein YC2023_018465 [Brassica napus]
MAGTSTKKVRKPSKRSKPSPLPSQYCFTPRTTEPPPPGNRGAGPTVSDYPPPRHLFEDCSSGKMVTYREVIRDIVPVRPKHEEMLCSDCKKMRSEPFDKSSVKKDLKSQNHLPTITTQHNKCST